jgi:hypothetical protein
MSSAQQNNPAVSPLLKAVPGKIYRRLIVRYPFQTDADFANAYHFSAKRLAETFTGQPVDDLLLLPFLNLYRQAFELGLKNTIKAFVRIRIIYVEGRTAELVGAASEDVLKRRLGHNLHKLLNEAKKQYLALDVPEDFPETVERLTMMLHHTDGRGTAFRYAGELPEIQEDADFPDLAKLLDEQFLLLSVLEDYVDGVFSAMPTLEELM